MNKKKTSVDVYERLADALEALPSGFTRMPSKLEVEMIKIVFTHEEASLVGQLTITPETAAEIAKRVGLDEEEVIVLCESMVPRRMVRADTLALETGVKGMGKLEADADQEKEEPVRTRPQHPIAMDQQHGDEQQCERAAQFEPAQGQACEQRQESLRGSRLGIDTAPDCDDEQQREQ